MRMLITGAAGFIGSNYVRKLLTGAYPRHTHAHVTVLDKLTYAGNPANLAAVAGHPRLTLVTGDITDTALLADLVPGHDTIINFAAETHVDRSITGAAPFIHTNVTGTHTLLEAARTARTPRFLQVSTDEVYGSITTGSWTEDHPLQPNSPYAASKAAGDLIARAYARTHGMNITITRCGNNYGPHQHPEKLIPLFITNLLDHRPVPLYGTGDNVRDWLHVDDHCRGIHLALETGAPGETYNIGGGTELTNRHLTGLLLRALDADPHLLHHVPDRPGHDHRYSLDDTKLRRLGYTPRVDFTTGLAATIAWYRDNRAWWQPLKNPAPADATT
ncbi:dTDP-glucose 4,6-dehydratase [Marinactinospora rubrisoli]|uniref:dTDP-glucose 4,6-dehydratase n=1 Tax=Marinactinospora rubrisoli TaxID=2715399 RepID=A0ABW2KQM3_9ACTN